MELSPQLLHHGSHNPSVSVHKITGGKFAYKSHRESYQIAQFHKIGNNREPDSVYSVGLKYPHPPKVPRTKNLHPHTHSDHHRAGN